MVQYKKNNIKFIEEYKKFLSDRLLPLIGVSSDNLIDINEKNKDSTFIFYDKDSYNLFFSTNEQRVFKLNDIKTLPDENVKLAQEIITMFFSISMFSYDSNSSKKINFYQSQTQLKKNYDWAIQKGICNWTVGKRSNKIEELIELLEQWSVKTYEGKKVTFGFIINPEEKSEFGDTYGNWLEFLKDDFSAVFTDCINSVIELDADCNFCKYISITKNNYIDSYNLSNLLPIRFSNIIEKNIIDKNIGIFLLNNGDIILSKAKEIYFVKRNCKWLNFNYNAFENAVNSKLKFILEENLLKNVYSSIL